MKKLLSLLLCIVFVCFALIGCAQKEIGEDLDKYKPNTTTNDKIEKLNFYIVTGDATSNEAKITVPQNINAYIKEKYSIELNVVYCSLAEYDQVVSTAMANTDETLRPDVVLINSKSLFDSLQATDSFVALNDFYNHRDFRSINTIVDASLLAASAVSEDDKVTYYTVPNNHVVGEYKYVVIDKSMARDTLHFSNEEIEAMNTEESLKELIDAIKAYYNSDACTSELSEDEFVAQYVTVDFVSGSYADKLLLEYGVSSTAEITETSTKVNFVNINSYPNATAEEAFASAFAIVRHLDDVGTHTEEKQAELDSHYTKCMKVIYALNTDAQLKNMLQYGYAGTNYSFVKNHKNENTNYIILEDEPEFVYQMNPIYTGNLFISYYCEEIGWNETVHSDILKQNADAKTPAQKVAAELDKLTLDKTATSETVIQLLMHGEVYSDIVYTWTSSNPEVATVNADGTLTFTQPEANTKVTITAVITVAGMSASKEFQVTVEAEA